MLKEVLDEDEKLLWRRLPSATGYGRDVLVVRILGHVLLTLTSVGVALCIPAGRSVQIAVGAVFCVASNAPLLVWAATKRHVQRGGSEALYFVTDRRLGVVEPSGEFKQVPIAPGLEMNTVPAIVEFVYQGHVCVSFAGLKESEQRLVTTLVQHVLQRQQTPSP